MVHYTKNKGHNTSEVFDRLRRAMPGTVRLSGSIEEGLIPTEKIVRVEDADGDFEEIPVSSASISDGKLMASEIGRTKDGRVLVELPRESASGRWRIWVKASAVGA
jgi:hypothetical protein